jgi:neurotransmitter:Na+ symporter, NSS family
VVGLVQVIVIAWVLRHLRDLADHANPISDIALGWWWRIALAAITPLMLGLMIFDNFRTVATEGYEDYPAWFIGLAGWGVAGAVIVVALALPLKDWHRSTAVETEAIRREHAEARAQARER